MRFRVLYKNPEDPAAKPPPVAAAEFGLPAGLRIHNDVLPKCTATEEEFRARGRAACPAETQIGAGTLVAMTGFPGADPVRTDVVAFNGDGEIVEVVFFEGTNAYAGMDRLTIEEGKLVAHPPAIPGGPPDGRTAVREVRLEFPPRTGADDRPYVTAPPECTGGRWSAVARYEFADGGRTTVPTEMPCVAAAPPRRALAASVTPRRVRAGQRRTFTVVATAADRSCVDGALVRLGKRRVRTRAAGRATLTARFRRPGRKRVLVSKAGCTAAHATIRVRPARR